MKKRRFKLFWITPECLLNFFQNCMKDKKFNIEGVPKTAEYVNVFYNPLRNCFGIILHHKSFPVLQKAELIPELKNVVITIVGTKKAE